MSINPKSVNRIVNSAISSVQNSEIECKTVKLKMIDSSDKIERRQTKSDGEKNETKIETLHLIFNTKTS